jgi:hypothetical protein
MTNDCRLKSRGSAVTFASNLWKIRMPVNAGIRHFSVVKTKSLIGLGFAGEPDAGWGALATVYCENA